MSSAQRGMSNNTKIRVLGAGCAKPPQKEKHMNYQEYEILFQIEAHKAGKTDDYITKCLQYAKPLLDKGLPVIYDSEHLSMLVGYKRTYIKHAVTYMDYYYWDYKIPKKSGGLRTIKEPMPNLKDIQLWILHNILYKISFHPYAKAYVPHKSIRDNVRFHTKKKVVLTLDIHDFFGNVPQNAVRKMFQNMGYAEWVADLLAKLTCLKGCLPQGAPTSPALSNMYMYDVDEELKKYCLEHKIMYTRYADDMTFSGDFDIQPLLEKVKNLLLELGLCLNEKKTHIMYNNQRQIVTGCIVNQRTHIPTEQLKKIRQEMYFIKKFGLENHLNKINCEKRNYIKHLYGRINYALLVQPGNQELKEYKKYLRINYEEKVIGFEE